MSSSSSSINGNSYAQIEADEVFYHTLETVATPTDDSSFTPQILSSSYDAEYQDTASSTIASILSSDQSALQTQYDNLGLSSYTQPTLSLTGFLAQYTEFNLPSSWSGFISGLEAYMTPTLPAGTKLPTGDSLTTVLTSAQVTQILNAYVSDYEYDLKFPTSYSNGTGVPFSEWNDVIAGLATQISGNATPTESQLENAFTLLQNSMTSQFEDSFASFLQTFPYTQTTETLNGQTTGTGEQATITPTAFTSAFDSYLVASATLTSGTYPATVIGQTSSGQSESQGPAYQSYLTLYESYFPPTAADTASDSTTYMQNYQATLMAFLNQQFPSSNAGSTYTQDIANGATNIAAFVPSQSFSAWATFVQNQFQVNQSQTAIPSTSIGPLLTQEYQTLISQLTTNSTNLSWLPSSITNQLPAQNLTQDMSNAIQTAYYALNPDSDSLETPNSSISQADINAAVYIRSVIQSTGVSIGTALSQLSSTNVSQLPQAALTALNGLGIVTTGQLSSYQIGLIQNAVNDPTSTTNAAVLEAASALKTQATQTVLNNVISDPGEAFGTSIYTGTVTGASEGSGGTSSVNADGSGHKLVILNSIFELIVSLIGTMQDVAAAQSNYLNFLSEWQNAYVALQNQLHSFYSGNGDYIDGDGSGTTVLSADFYVKGADSAGCTDLNSTNNVRDTLNNTINANLTQVIQNNRGQIADVAKTVQSDVSNESDAVNTQANMATTIIQELESMLTIIFQH